MILRYDQFRYNSVTVLHEERRCGIEVFAFKPLAVYYVI